MSHFASFKCKKNGITKQNGDWKMKHAQTFSILIWAKRMQAHQETSKRNLYARVTVDGKRTEISLKHTVDESQWDTGIQWQAS